MFLLSKVRDIVEIVSVMVVTLLIYKDKCYVCQNDHVGVILVSLLLSTYLIVIITNCGGMHSLKFQVENLINLRISAERYQGLLK